MTRDHYLLKDVLNHRAQVKAENERMEELESHATPLFVAFIVAVILGVLGLSLTRYVNVQNTELQRTAQILADCMNGGAVSVDDQIMHCTIERYSLADSVKKINPGEKR